MDLFIKATKEKALTIAELELLVSALLHSRVPFSLSFVPPTPGSPGLATLAFVPGPKLQFSLLIPLSD